ncbi:MAG TPA: GAF domain-containing protein, partial [Novosphingobium sp.]|nr:GAF domain-containing protein [Novosphingobium sp.]
MTKRNGRSGDPSEIDKLRRHVRILFDLARIAGQHVDAAHFLGQAVIQVARALEVDHVKLLRYRPKSADLLMEAGLGWKEGVVGAANFPSDMRSPAGRAFRTAEPVCLTDLADSPEFVLSPMLAEHGIASLANVPILMNGAAWGVLEVDSSTPREFSEDSLAFLGAAAAIIGATFAREVAARGEATALAEAAAQAQYREVLLREL